MYYKRVEPKRFLSPNNNISQCLRYNILLYYGIRDSTESQNVAINNNLYSTLDLYELIRLLLYYVYCGRTDAIERPKNEIELSNY